MKTLCLKEKFHLWFVRKRWKVHIYAGCERALVQPPHAHSGRPGCWGLWGRKTLVWASTAAPKGGPLVLQYWTQAPSLLGSVLAPKLTFQSARRGLQPLGYCAGPYLKHFFLRLDCCELWTFFSKTMEMKENQIRMKSWNNRIQR